MDKQYFQQLADYVSWTNDIVMEWLDQISDEQWEQLIASSFSSIKLTALHIASAQKIWIDWWTDVPDPVFLSAEFEGTKDDFIAIWKTIAPRLKAFVDDYPEANYHQPFTFRWPGLGECQMEFWQTFSHFVNHSTYHRGQLVTLLRQAGFTSFRSTDLASYFL